MSERRIKKPWRMSTHLFPELILQKRHLSLLMVCSTNSYKLSNVKENHFRGLICTMFNRNIVFRNENLFHYLYPYSYFNHIVFMKSYFISFENNFRILLPRNNFCMLIIISKKWRNKCTTNDTLL